MNDLIDKLENAISILEQAYEKAEKAKVDGQECTGYLMNRIEHVKNILEGMR